MRNDPCCYGIPFTTPDGSPLIPCGKPSKRKAGKESPETLN
jgi:hypothetical protein